MSLARIISQNSKKQGAQQCTPFIVDWSALWLLMFLSESSGTLVPIVFIRNKTFLSLIVSLFLQHFAALCQASRSTQYKTAVVKGRVELWHRSYHLFTHNDCPPHLVTVNVNMLDWQSQHARYINVKVRYLSAP